MRKPGYYWVKYDGEWFIAKWRLECVLSKFEWDLFDRSYEDYDFEEIDEHRIERQPPTDELIRTSINKEDFLRRYNSKI